MRRGIPLCLAIILYGVAPSPGSAADAKTRFAADAAAGWNALGDWEKSIEIVGVRSPRTAREGQRKLRYVSWDDFVLAEESATSGQDRRSVYAANGDYGFWVNRKADGAYVLRFLYEGRKRAGVKSDISVRYAADLFSYRGLGGKSFQKLDAEKGFTWGGVDAAGEGGQDLVTAHYRREVEYQGVKGPVPVVGFVKLDPSNHWACVESDSRLERPGPETKDIAVRDVTRVTYSSTPVGGVRPPSRVVSDTYWAADGKPMTTVFEVEKVSLPTGDETQFRLSGYGLPEAVAGPPPKRSGLWAWLVGGMLLCLVIAAILSRRPGRGPRPKSLTA